MNYLFFLIYLAAHSSRVGTSTWSADVWFSVSTNLFPNKSTLSNLRCRKPAGKIVNWFPENDTSFKFSSLPNVGGIFSNKLLSIFMLTKPCSSHMYTGRWFILLSLRSRTCNEFCNLSLKHIFRGNFSNLLFFSFSSARFRSLPMSSIKSVRLLSLRSRLTRFRNKHILESSLFILQAWTWNQGSRKTMIQNNKITI